MNVNIWFILPVLLPVRAEIPKGPKVLRNDSARFPGPAANGVVYDPVKYPYLIRLNITDDIGNIALCAGSLLNQRFVLTAAHCTENRPNVTHYKVYYQRYSRDDFYLVKAIHDHPQYNTNTCVSDLSVVELMAPVTAAKMFVRIGGKPSDFAHGKAVKCTLLGYGGFMTETLVYYGPKKCAGYNWSRSAKDTAKEFLCASIDIHTTCHEDSGGPMICNGYQYGVCSHKFPVNKNTTKEVCGGLRHQNRHVFLYNYIAWLESITDFSKGNLQETGELMKLIEPVELEYPKGTDGLEVTEYPKGTDGLEVSEYPKGTDGLEVTEYPTVPDGLEDSDYPTVPDGLEDSDYPTVPDGLEDSDYPTVPDGPVDSDYPTGPDGPADSDYPTGPDGPADSDYPTGPDGQVDSDYPTGPDGPVDSDYPTNRDGLAEPEYPDYPVTPKKRKKNRKKNCGFIPSHKLYYVVLFWTLFIMFLK